MSNLKVTVCTSTLSMDNSLRDSFSVELGEFVNQVEVLKKYRSSRSSSQRVLIVVNWHTSACSQSLSFHNSFMILLFSLSRIFLN
jgi:hypothetical protein